MSRKYIYIPQDTLAFKEYAILQAFWNSIKHKDVKPMTYVEYQIMRRYYAFDEIIDIITDISIKGQWGEYKGLYEALKAFNNKEEVFYEGKRNNKGYNPRKSKRVHNRVRKRKGSHRERQAYEVIRKIFH